MKLWWLVLLVACESSKPAPSRTPAPSGSAPTTDAAPVAAPAAALTAAATSVAQASIASAPRASWPCAVKSDSIVQFVYASDEPCTIPITEWFKTLGGCPTQLAYDGKLSTTQKYDDKRRLLYLEEGPFRYEWDATGVKTKYIRDTPYPYTLRDGKLLGGDGPDGPAEAYRIDAKGRPLAVDVYGPDGVAWTTSVEYDGDRPIRRVRVSKGDTTESSEILYDCSKLPAPKP